MWNTCDTLAEGRINIYMIPDYCSISRNKEPGLRGWGVFSNSLRRAKVGVICHFDPKDSTLTGLPP